MFSVLKKLSWFFKENWRRYTVSIVLLAIAGLIDILPPKLIGMEIDDIRTGVMAKGLILRYMLILSSITVVSYLVTYIWHYKLFGGAYLVERKLRSRFMGHLLKMAPPFFEKNRTGDLMARATNDIKAISMTAGFGILTLADSTIWMLTILLTMGITISWKLTFVAILPLPVMAVLMNLYGKKIHGSFMKAQDAFGDLNDRVLESIAGVRVIRSYVQEENEKKTFHELTEGLFAKNLAVAKVDSLFQPTIKILVGVSYMIGLGYGAKLVFSQQITLGELVSFNVYLGMLIWPMFAVGEMINIMQRGNASLDRVQEILSYKQDVRNIAQPVAVDSPDSIEFKDVAFRYPSSKHDNLSEINVELKQGETLGIVGKTGSGKTTFIKQLLREYPAGTGKLAISDVPIEEQPLEEVRSWIGYVPQDHVLFSRSIRENILFGNREAGEEELQRAIDSAAFRKDLGNLPEGLKTLVGEKGVALSGGQKQRISIARALIKDPEILILDDSLSAVDAKTEQKIIENIRTDRAGKTTVITTHRMSAVMHADRIIVLEDGKIVEQGTHEQLMAKGGWYKEQFERQQAEIAVEEGVSI
ncbi:ATP-binding cassette domain-containing protein [Neobacillus notoginsengisoli]|uniref:ATP-binding cassette domain-containing protein n=1 Tax=Neobacillus notoginsengisoli TaxID=1578198 RepID=A0A417YLD4_9BACI|nr:ABC transporter transmembrane domain-containing protein [Neobacillus notoginsengisoli]RHW34182.1 ATP-binding cassette domain-containing protein [Neobacillus notoginsengisoli]